MAAAVWQLSLQARNSNSSALTIIFPAPGRTPPARHLMEMVEPLTYHPTLPIHIQKFHLNHISLQKEE